MKANHNANRAPLRDIVCYHLEVLVLTNVLIRDVPDHVLASLDAHAARLGLSRNEYVRRQLAAEAQRLGRSVTYADLQRSTEAAQDLLDPDVLAQAWT